MQSPKYFIIINNFTFDLKSGFIYNITMNAEPNKHIYLRGIDVSWQKLVLNHDYWLSSDDLHRLHVYQDNKFVIPVTKHLKSDLKAWSQKLFLAKITDCFSRDVKNND